MSERDYRLYINDILESAQFIQEFVENYTLETFNYDRKTYSAVIREFEIIGEAVGKLPSEVKQQYPDVPWQDIKDFRNFLTHEYFGIDLEIVWQVIHDELPLLFNAIKKISLNSVDE